MLRNMVYPSSFYRMVAIGDLYGDNFNFSLAIVPIGDFGNTIPAVSTALVTAVGVAVSTWFGNSTSNTGPALTAGAHLTSVKLNRINAAGKYQDDVTKEYVVEPPRAGSEATYPAAQLAAVVTLKTSVERGLASKGRFYLPPSFLFNFLGSDGRLTTTQAGNLSGAAVELINKINQAVLDVRGPIDLMRVGVASNVGSGQFRQVTKVGVGRVPDTMRSRREGLVEERVDLPVLPPS